MSSLRRLCSPSVPLPLSAEAASATLSGSKPAKITRGGKVFYMPRRHSAADRERDQQLLSEIPLGSSPDEVSAAIVQLKAQREEDIAIRLSGELHASGSPSLPSPLPAVAASATLSGSHCAKITRGGMIFYMPLRHSAADRERDKTLLDSIPCGTSFELARARVLEIRAQRDREIASGVLECEALGPPSTRKQTCLHDSFLRAQHAHAVQEACSWEAMKCFLVEGPHAEYKLASDENVNVFLEFEMLVTRVG